MAPSLPAAGSCGPDCEIRPASYARLFRPVKEPEPPAAATCSTAAAATKSIWPHQLRPYGQQSVSAAAAEVATFYAPLRLKPGKRIARFSMYACCCNPATLVARIYRRRMGGPAELVAEIDRTNAAYAPSWHHDEEIELPLVRRGYQYFVRVFFGNYIPDLYGLKVVLR